MLSWDLLAKSGVGWLGVGEGWVHKKSLGTVYLSTQPPADGGAASSGRGLLLQILEVSTH